MIKINKIEVSEMEVELLVDLLLNMPEKERERQITLLAKASWVESRPQAIKEQYIAALSTREKSRLISELKKLERLDLVFSHFTERKTKGSLLNAKIPEKTKKAA